MILDTDTHQESPKDKIVGLLRVDANASDEAIIFAIKEAAENVEALTASTRIDCSLFNKFVEGVTNSELHDKAREAVKKLWLAYIRYTLSIVVDAAYQGGKDFWNEEVLNSAIKGEFSGFEGAGITRRDIEGVFATLQYDYLLFAVDLPENYPFDMKILALLESYLDDSENMLEGLTPEKVESLVDRVHFFLGEREGVSDRVMVMSNKIEGYKKRYAAQFQEKDSN